MTLVDGPVRVEVPATSANLGAGLRLARARSGAARPLEAEVWARAGRRDRPGGCRLGPAGRVPTRRPLDARRVRGARRDRARPTARCHNVIPHARGLGSSSAAIVGGLALARALVAEGAERLDDDALFRPGRGPRGPPRQRRPGDVRRVRHPGTRGGRMVRRPVAGRPPDRGGGVRPAGPGLDRGGAWPAAGHRPARRCRRGRRADRAARGRARRAPRSALRRPATTCTRSTGGRPCPTRSTSWTGSGATGSPRSCRGPARPCWSSPTRPRSRPLTSPAPVPVGWEQHMLLVADEGVRVACDPVIHWRHAVLAA